MQNLLRQNADGTVSKLGYVKVGAASGWRTCDPAKPIPATLTDWLSAFGAMLGAADAVNESITGQSTFLLGGDCCPIVCLRLWNIVCNRIVLDHRQELQRARMTLPTPPELTGSVSQSFTAMSCEYAGAFVDAIVAAVEYPSASMPLVERVAYESAYLKENLGIVGKRWPKARLKASEWYRLVELELTACPWLMNAQKTPRHFSKPITSTALRTECLEAKLDIGNGNTGERAWRTFKNNLIAEGTFRLADNSKPKGKLLVDTNFLNRHGIKLP